MERRRLQATGGSSLTLTLPKGWLERWQLKSKDEVLVTANGPTLIIKPAGRSSQQTVIEISLDDKQPEWIVREIIGAYVAGADKIVLEAKRISPKQNERIRQTFQQLFGFEILEETSHSIVAHNVIDNSQFPVADNARRVYSIMSSMITDALRAAQTGDKDLAHDVILRDQEVNKLVYAIERRLAQVANGQAEGNLGEVNYYCSVATQFERIGDRAVIIANLVTKDLTGPIELSNTFPTIREAITGLMEEVGDLLKTPTVKHAHEILDQNEKLAPLMYSSERIKQTYEGAVVEDSLDRLRGRLMNVAELTIDYLMLTHPS
jgi:phosphate uptake regulator